MPDFLKNEIILQPCHTKIKGRIQINNNIQGVLLKIYKNVLNYPQAQFNKPIVTIT